MTDEERQMLLHKLRMAQESEIGDWFLCAEAADELERLAEELRITNKALSMCSDECNKLYEKYDKKLDIIEEYNKLAQSDAEPEYQDVRRKGRSRLVYDKEKRTIVPEPSQSDAEPVTLKTRFEEWSFAEGHRNFTKLGGGYLLPEIQKDWLAFRAALAQSDAEPVAPIEADPLDPTREYIPLPAQWEIQTKGKGSSYRLLDRKTGKRMTIMCADTYREHDFVTRMAKEIHAAVSTAPPHPSASALIGAAEWLEANTALWGAVSVAKWLRARATDRESNNTDQRLN